jgi:chromosome partitioning protein
MDATLSRLTQAALVRVRDSQVYVRAASEGRSIFDDASSATREHRADWQALLDFIERQFEVRQGQVVTPISAASRVREGS